MTAVLRSRCSGMAVVPSDQVRDPAADVPCHRPDPRSTGRGADGLLRAWRDGQARTMSSSLMPSRTSPLAWPLPTSTGTPTSEPYSVHDPS